jgi:hypothetical protein
MIVERYGQTDPTVDEDIAALKGAAVRHFCAVQRSG